MDVTIYTTGELLVESLVKKENQGLSRPDGFWGPYPSGALTIFTDQVAKLDPGSVLLSYVGNDASGEMNIVRLEKDGTSVNGTAILQKAIIGSALVSYCSWVQRDPISNMPNSTCGLLTVDCIDEVLLNRCQYFRIMESPLFSFHIIDVMRKATEGIKDRNGTISFDPNAREEAPSIPETSRASEYIFDYIDIFLPNGDKLDYFGPNPERNEQILVDNSLKRGVKHVVIKRGPRGASYFSADETHRIVGLDVPVVDPAGARDCFSTTFVSLSPNGATPQEALRRTNASGSLAISQCGLMEGTSMQAQICAFPTTQHP